MEISRPQPRQPRPKDAEPVFKGTIFDIYQWKQKVFDGTEATWEVVKRADTAVVIPITAQGKIIIIDQEQPGRPSFLGFPGGRVEEGEDVLQAAGRELKEETGYEAAELVLLKAEQPMSKLDWAVYIFMAYGCVKKTPQTLDAGEKISVREVTFDELVTLIDEKKMSSPELLEMVLRAKADPAKMSELKKIFRQ